MMLRSRRLYIVFITTLPLPARFYMGACRYCGQQVSAGAEQKIHRAEREVSMRQLEEPLETRSLAPLPVFVIGRNRIGNWVVQDQEGECGGLFVSRAEALKFAKSENEVRPHAFVMASGTIELDVARNSAATRH